MKNVFVKKLIAVCLIVFACVPVFCENAVLTYLKGKVEVSHDGKEWVPLKVGDKLAENDVISTGFQSEAKVKYNGSVLLMGALTRVTLHQLSSSSAKDNVDVFLNTGAVRSKVTHSADKKVSYTVRSPVAVACVRGTDFITRSSGRIDCLEGAVAVFSARAYNSIMPESNQGTAKSDEENESSSGDSSDKAIPVSNNDVSESTGDAPVITGGPSNEKPQGPATATTLARDISENVPSNAIVVGKNQATEFSRFSNGVKPHDVATTTVQKVKQSMASAASQEAVPFGSPAASEQKKQDPAQTNPVAPGTINITFTFED